MRWTDTICNGTLGRRTIKSTPKTLNCKCDVTHIYVRDGKCQICGGKTPVKVIKEISDDW